MVATSATGLAMRLMSQSSNAALTARAGIVQRFDDLALVLPWRDRCTATCAGRWLAVSIS